MEEQKVEFEKMSRYETECCGFLFNTTHYRPVLDESEPVTARVIGDGMYLLGECMGCGDKHPEVNKLRV